MNLSLSEALDRVRKWESHRTRLHVVITADASPMTVNFRGCVSVHGHVIVLDGKNGIDLTLGFVPDLKFTYNDALLEIRGSGWCCYLFGNRPDLKLVK